MANKGGQGAADRETQSPPKEGGEILQPSKIIANKKQREERERKSAAHAKVTRFHVGMGVGVCGAFQPCSRQQVCRRSAPEY